VKVWRLILNMVKSKSIKTIV